MALFDLPLAELERYRPEIPEPPDLDAFWAATLAESRAVGDPVSVVPVDTGLTLVDTWDVTFPGFGGHPVRAWYTRPAGVDTDLPAVVEFLGYGRGRGLPTERLTWANAGYAHLLMDTRGQGGQYGNGGDTPDPVGSDAAAPGFVTRGILDPSTAYYRRVYTDGVRAVDAVRTLPGVDPTRVAVLGNSQGGGIALAVAGIVPDLAAVAASAPFLCHVQRAVGLVDTEPYAEIVRYLSVHRDAAPAVFRTLSYLDAASLVRRARAAVLVGTGLRDTVCPPSTAFAAYHAYADGDPTVPRDIAVYPFNHHEGGDAHHVSRVLAWFATHLLP
jgi:cephalosporin-C deacetylase